MQTTIDNIKTNYNIFISVYIHLDIVKIRQALLLTSKRYSALTEWLSALLVTIDSAPSFDFVLKFEGILREVISSLNLEIRALIEFITRRIKTVS